MAHDKQYNDIVEAQLKEVVFGELEVVENKYPKFHSGHEGYAVILEEYEELEQELIVTKHTLDMLWNQIKTDSNDEGLSATSEQLFQYSMKLMKEAVQVSAMALRFRSNVLGIDVYEENNIDPLN